MNNSKTVGIIAICKDENEYIQEWIDHHKKLGFNKFVIGDNQSKIPIQIDDPCVTVISWNDNEIGSQMRFYYEANQLFNINDWVATIDIDEFICLSPLIKSIQKFIDGMTYNKEIGAFGISWRMYGYKGDREGRVHIEEYKHWYPDNHIKTLYRVGDCAAFYDPHHIYCLGKYINEWGHPIVGPHNQHTSTFIWIKHTWTRSLPEFLEKIKRGSGDKVVRNYSEDNYHQYQSKLIYADKDVIQDPSEKV